LQTDWHSISYLNETDRRTFSATIFIFFRKYDLFISRSKFLLFFISEIIFQVENLEKVLFITNLIQFEKKYLRYYCVSLRGGWGVFCVWLLIFKARRGVQISCFLNHLILFFLFNFPFSFKQFSTTIHTPLQPTFFF
jgi:ABC-type polysaccharide/polyol phosphate export permease